MLAAVQAPQSVLVASLASLLAEQPSGGPGDAVFVGPTSRTGWTLVVGPASLEHAVLDGSVPSLDIRLDEPLLVLRTSLEHSITWRSDGTEEQQRAYAHSLARSFEVDADTTMRALAHARGEELLPALGSALGLADPGHALAGRAVAMRRGQRDVVRRAGRHVGPAVLLPDADGWNVVAPLDRPESAHDAAAAMMILSADREPAWTVAGAPGSVEITLRLASKRSFFRRTWNSHRIHVPVPGWEQVPSGPAMPEDLWRPLARYLTGSDVGGVADGPGDRVLARVVSDWLQASHVGRALAASRAELSSMGEGLLPLATPQRLSETVRAAAVLASSLVLLLAGMLGALAAVLALGAQNPSFRGFFGTPATQSIAIGLVLAFAGGSGLWQVRRSPRGIIRLPRTRMAPGSHVGGPD